MFYLKTTIFNYDIFRTYFFNNYINHFTMNTTSYYNNHDIQNNHSLSIDNRNDTISHGYPTVAELDEEISGEFYPVPDKDTLQKKLTPLQWEVTQNGATEPPFANIYDDEFRPGVYVDITSGQPLFLSTDKYDSGCGWPAFTRPISDELIKNVKDNSYGMKRTEVRAANSNSHLGHVFNDGPRSSGGLRYCINSASLRFIPLEEMESQGYGYLIDLIE